MQFYSTMFKSLKIHLLWNSLDIIGAYLALVISPLGWHSAVFMLPLYRKLSVNIWSHQLSMCSGSWSHMHSSVTSRVCPLGKPQRRVERGHMSSESGEVVLRVRWGIQVLTVEGRWFWELWGPGSESRLGEGTGILPSLQMPPLLLLLPLHDVPTPALALKAAAAVLYPCGATLAAGAWSSWDGEKCWDPS